MENAGNDSFIPKKTSEEEGQLKIVVSEKIGNVFCSTASFLPAPCNVIPEGCNHACYVKQKNGYHLYINQTLSRENYFCLKCNSFIHSTDSFEEHLKKLHSIKPATKKKKKSTKSLKSTSSVKPVFKIKQPTEFNDYLLGSELGKGAYGCVYKGFSTRSGNYVAIKTIELQNKDSLEGVQQEIDIMKHLDHVNIIRYIESHKTDDYLYIVMEYAEQGSLQSIQKEYGNFSERLAAKYTQEILKGLQYLHSQYIIHHDIKQGNILMINNMPKLSDFGISIKLDSNLAAAFDSQCSPYWAAPEIINGEAVTEKSDIWALGITVIEMIDGQPPYFDLDPIPAMYKIAQGLDTPLPDKISPELKDFLQICLKRDQVFRASVEDLLSHPWIKMKTAEDDFSYDDYGAMEYMSPNKFSVQRSNSSSNELHLVRSDSSSKPGLNISDLSQFKDDSSDSDDLFTSQTLNQSNKPLLTVKPNELRPLDEDLLDSTLTNFNSIDNDEKQISLNDFADDDDSDMDCFATTGRLKLQSVPSTPHATSSNKSGLDAFCEDDDNDNDIFGDSKGPGLLTLNTNTPLLQLNSNTNKKTTLNDMTDSDDDDLFEDTPSNNKPLIQLNPATPNKPLLTLPTTNNKPTLDDMKESDDDDLFEDTPSNNKPLLTLPTANNKPTLDDMKDSDDDLFEDTPSNNKPLLTLPTTNNKPTLNDMKDSDEDDLFEDTPSNNKPLIQLNPTTQNKPLLTLPTADSKPALDNLKESDDDDLFEDSPSNNMPLLTLPTTNNKPTLDDMKDSDDDLFEDAPSNNKPLIQLNPVAQNKPLLTLPTTTNKPTLDDMKDSDDDDLFEDTPSNNKPLIQLNPTTQNKPLLTLPTTNSKPESNESDDDDLFEDAPSNNKPLLQLTPHKQNKPPLPLKPDNNRLPLIPNQPLKNRTISAPIQKPSPLNTEEILFTDASSDDQSDDTPAFLSKPPLLSLTPEINNKPSIDLTIKPNPPASNSIDFLKNIDDLFEDDDAEQQEKEKMNELMKTTINEIDLLISLCQDPLKTNDMIHICSKLYTKFSTEPFLKENLAGFHGVLPIVSLIQTHNQVLLENAFPFILVATTDQIETQNLLCLLGILPYLFEYVIDRKYSEDIQQYSLDMLHSFCISMGKPLQFFVTTGGLPKIAKVFELYSHQERPELTKPVIEIIDAVFNFHSSTPKSCFARIAAQSNLISLLGQRFADLSYDDPLLEILCKIFEVFSTGSTQVKIKMADSEYIDNIFTKARSNPNGTEHKIEQSKTNSSDLNDWNLYTIIKAMNNLAMDKNVIPTLWKTNFVTRLIEHIQAVGQHTMDLMQSTCFTAIFHLTRILVPENLPKIKSLIPLLPWIIMNDTSVKEIATTIFLDIINEHIDVDDTRIELQNNQGIDTLLYLLETSNHKENIIASLVTWAARDSALIGSELIKHIETVVEIVKTVFEEDLQIHQAPFANNFLEICDRCCDFTQKLEEVGFANFIVNKLISDDYKDNAELRKAFLLFILSILQSSQNPEMIREKCNLEYVGNKFLNDSSMPVKNLAAELLQSIRT